MKWAKWPLGALALTLWSIVLVDTIIKPKRPSGHLDMEGFLSSAYWRRDMLDFGLVVAGFVAAALAWWSWRLSHRQQTSQSLSSNSDGT